MPFSIDARHTLCLCFAVTLVVVGCSRLPTVRLDPPFGRSDWIELSDSRVIEGARPALVVTISNPKKIPLWIRMEIDEIDGRDDCMASFKLAPKMSHLYSCGQDDVSVGKRFRAEAIVYKDAGNTKATETIRRLVEIQKGPNGELILVGRPPE